MINNKVNGLIGLAMRAGKVVFGTESTLQEIENADTSNVWIEVLEETIGQYTELKDKNEKEIYEGDIVKINDEIIAKVIWDNDYLGYFLYANEENSIDSFENGEQPLYDYWGSIEVIGNIYDNPELLEKGE